MLKPNFHIPKITLLYTILFFSFSLKAQYVNTDSLVIVPGCPEPLTINQASLIEPKGNLDNSSFFAGFLVPGGKGEVISQFGPRSGRMHYGTDIKMLKGDTVVAVASGTIYSAKWGNGFGNIVIVWHENNIQTYYAHLSKFLVKRGEWVAKGEPIGLAGSTGRARGSHLHFEIRENLQPFDSELVFDYLKQEVRKEARETGTLLALHRKLKPNGYSNNVAVPEFYKVRPGDSLWVISKRFKTPITRICRLNQITESSVLQIGQPLRMY